MVSHSNLLPPILRLPPELRLEIYRHLLVANRTVRMVWLTDDDSFYYPNCLFPAILRTCHLIHNEAAGVLYGENVFRAHRIDDKNDNAASIKQAKFLIGIVKPDDAENDASKLLKFIEKHPSLHHLVLEFVFRLLEDSKLRNQITDMLFRSCYSYSLTVRSAFQSTRSAYNAAEIKGTVTSFALQRKLYGEDLKKFSDRMRLRNQALDQLTSSTLV